MTDSARLMTRERRDRLAATLVKWLDDVLDEEAPPSDLAKEMLEALERDDPWAEDDETETDWYGLQASLTALTQEVKLQSRAFARLSDQLDAGAAASSVASPDETTLQLVRIRETLDEVVRGSGPREAEMLSSEGVALLLDIRDRLSTAEVTTVHSLEAAEAALPKWWPARALIRQSSTRMLDGYRSLLNGYRMTLERLDDTLATVGISETARVGDMFDPTTMKVVDIEARDNDKEGTVLAIYRRGYRQAGELLRLAEVKVARAQAGPVGKGVEE